MESQAVRTNGSEVTVVWIRRLLLKMTLKRLSLGLGGYAAEIVIMEGGSAIVDEF